MAGRPAAQVDSSFFDSWSPQMAWALGLLFTDGHLRPAFRHTAPTVCFTQRSPELLLKLKALMRSNATVHYHPRREYNGRIAGETFRLAIANARLGQRLIELGLTPRKSLTMEFPKVPAVYARHFVRGCWDGDGTVYADPRGQLTAKFGCGSERFVQGMLAVLHRAGVSPRRLYRLRRSGRDVAYYYFAVSGASDIEFLFRYLYAKVPPVLYLQRKYEIFAEHVAGAEFTSL